MANKITHSLEDIEAILRQHKARLQTEFNVAEMAIFGSYLRREQTASSDLDLLVEFSEPISLFSFIRLRNLLCELLGMKVDLVMKDTLKRRIRDKVVHEAQRV